MTDLGRLTVDAPCRRSHPSGLVVSAVFAVALIARLGVALRGGGLLGNYGYDASGRPTCAPICSRVTH